MSSIKVTEMTILMTPNKKHHNSESYQHKNNTLKDTQHTNNRAQKIPNTDTPDF